MRNCKSVVLLDLWTDTNRGDCALQLGLIEMVRDRWPGAKVFGVFRFGFNEIETAQAETTFTAAALDAHSGGLRRTYYSAENHERFGPRTAKLLSLLSFIELSAALAAFKLHLYFLLPRSLRESMRRIATADILIWKGKNFRDYGGIGGINRQLTLLSAGIAGSLLNSNIHCVNASVWEMRNPVERKLVAFAFERCKSISVREPASLKAMQHFGSAFRKTHFAQDLSFYYLKRAPKPISRAAADSRGRHDVALTITKWGDSVSQRTYVDTLLRCVRDLTALGANRFVIVPQVTRRAEDNSELIEKLQQALANRNDVSVEVIPGSPSIAELLEIYSRACLLIGTRMHSCVFALAAGTPFVAIAYDHGPKWDILKQFWPERFLFTYGANAELVAEAASELYQQSGAVLEQAREKFLPLADESFSNVQGI
jgi:polysaccharide pyruvyl transferase WcaK-like protein